MRVVIADDDATLRALVRGILGDEEGFEVVGEAGDGTTAMALVAELEPDVVILDMAMPQPTGPEVLQHVKKTSPAIKVLLLTAYPDVMEPWIDLADGRLAKTQVSELPDRLRELTSE